MQLEYINKENKYKTVRQVLKQEFNIAGRLISKLKQEKAILLNEKSTYIDKELCLNDKISVKIDFDEPESSKIIPVYMNLNILYEDEAILIINKPSYMPVHPSSSHFTDTLSNGVKYYYNSKNIKHKVRLVNRLDKDTSRNCCFCQKCIYSRIFNRTNEAKYLFQRIYCIINRKFRNK